MPELPEVETIRRDLSVLVGKKISALKIISPKTASHSAAFFIKALSGQKLLEIQRRGKLLIFIWSNKVYLLVHLKMTGQLIYHSRQEKIMGGHSLGGTTYETAIGGKLPNKHTRAIFYFNGGGELYFNDLRRFGYLKLASEKEVTEILRDNYGPEPLTPAFSAEAFNFILKKRTSNIKAILLNQKLIAGLGNIYVDEALFAARILPTRRGNNIKPAEVIRLVKEINKIIKKAIAQRGTTFNNYVDAKGKQGNYSRHLQVYGRRGEKCLVCGEPLQRIKLSGRGTHYCANCQK